MINSSLDIKPLLCISFLLIVFQSNAAQSRMDSLKHVVKQDVSTTDRLDAYNILARYVRNDPDSMIKYGYQYYQLANEAESAYHISAATMYLGQSYKDLGAYEISLKYLFESIEATKNTDDKDFWGAYVVLGTVYGRLGDMSKSSYYFKKALDRESDGSEPLHSQGYMQTYNNLAEAYYQNDFPDSAYHYFNLSLQHAKAGNYKGYIEFIIGNIGMANLALGNLDSAESQLNVVLDYLSHSKPAYLTFKKFLAEVCLAKGDAERAEKMIAEVIDSALYMDFKEQLKDAYLVQYRIKKELGKYDESLEMYENYVSLNDEIKGLSTLRRINNLQSEYDLAQKEAEIQVYAAEKKSRDLVLVIVGVFFVLLGGFVIMLMRQNRSKSRMNVQLAQQKSELEVLNQTKDKFFSIISHDLRGPVSAFYGVSRMIKFLAISNRTDELIEMADDISKSVDRLSSLLDNLLNWAMQQRGNIPNVPEKIILKPFVLEIVDSLNTLAESKNISLTSDIDDQLVIWADKNITSTIIRNLISNALKFTPEGGQVSIIVEEKNRKASIVIRDSGVGIPEYKLKTLFNGHSDESTYGTAGEKGLGLGLQLVHEFVGMIDGKISVESQINTGTTFRFTVPKHTSAKELVEIR